MSYGDDYHMSNREAATFLLSVFALWIASLLLGGGR